MKNSSNKTKDSHALSYLLRHDKTYTFETGDGVPLKTLCGSKDLLLNNFAILWPTTIKAGLSSMKTKQ